MGFRFTLYFLLAFFVGASCAVAQSWKITTPRQSIQVPSDGSTIQYPNVNLVSGMKYRVHASNYAVVSSTKEIADACYYWQVIPFNPTVIPVTLRVKFDGVNEDWVYNFYKNSGFQIGAQISHIYDATIASSGFPLAFRFQDTQYGDNSGSINIEVARETPGVVVQKDTLNFGIVRVGVPKTLPDSIDSYGVEGYRVDNVSLLGKSTSAFSVISERPVPFVITDTTNEFLFTYNPTGNTFDTAAFHIFSSNAFGAEKERIIYLVGGGINTKISFSIDTLDFGTILTGTTKTLGDNIINGNSTRVKIVSILPNSPGSPYAVASTPLTVPASGSSPITVTFAPTKDGVYPETFNVITDNGSLFHFYATGNGGVPHPFFDTDVLDFGKIILKQSKRLTFEFGNDGGAPLNIKSITNTNPLDYSTNGTLSLIPIVYGAHRSEIYTVVFSPQVHIPACGNHDGKFIFVFGDGTSRTVTLKGCDHLPLDVKLSIDTLNYAIPGNEVTVTQKLINIGDPLDSTLTPVKALSETITFDPSLFDLVSVGKGRLINTNEWNVRSTVGVGKVDISFSSATAHLGPSGALLTFKFRAHTDTKPGQFTDLVHSSIDFGNALEPFALTSSGKITISDKCTPVHLGTGEMATSVEQNNPNPFNPSTHIQFSIGKNDVSEPVNIRISLYDQMGKFVGLLLDEKKTPGIYDLIFDGTEYASGAYTYVFESGGYLERKTMILVK